MPQGGATALASRRTRARHGARAYVQPRPLACAAVRTLVPRWPPSRFRLRYTESLLLVRATPPLSRRSRWSEDPRAGGTFLPPANVRSTPPCPTADPRLPLPTAVRIARAKRQYRAGLDVPFASDRQRASRTCLGFEHRTPLVAPAPPSRPSPLGLAVGLGPARHDEGCRRRVHENPARDTHAPALARKWQHSCNRCNRYVASDANIPCPQWLARVLAGLGELLTTRIREVSALYWRLQSIKLPFREK
ncbi:hypothetical protein B0H14DRAFT_3515063 [Mycena olivaceomarginata]|nr:hypothetical protein B0H14DRAFT_3515063 [Mycena olivaceomarginata]